MTIINSIVCAALFWVAGSFLLVSGQATRLRELALQFGLLAAMVGAAACFVAPFNHPEPISWWAILLRAGGAITALCAYDKRFGIRLQLSHAVFSLTAIPHDLSSWWRRSLAQAQRNAKPPRR